MPRHFLLLAVFITAPLVRAQSERSPDPYDADHVIQTAVPKITAWDSLSYIAALLNDTNPARHRAAVQILLRMRDVGRPTDPGLAAADASTKPTIVQRLDRYDAQTVGPHAVPRARLFDLIDAVAPDSPESAPLMFRALEDKDPAVRRRAQAAVDKLLAAPTDPFTLDGLLHTILNGDVSPKTADALLARVHGSARPALIELAAARLAAGHLGARKILASFKAEHLPLAQLAARAEALPPDSRRPLAILLHRLAHNAVDPVELAALLTGPDRAAADLAGQIARAAPGRVDEEAVRLAIANPSRPGRPQAPAAQDPVTAGAAALAPQPPAPPPATTITTLARALDASRPVAPAIDPAARALLAPLLAHPDQPLRLAAARALGDDAAFARAQLPTLLADLRAPAPHTRATAARQLQASTLLPPDVAAALIRATDRRDMPAREGLATAIEAAIATQRPPADVLADTARSDPDPTRRAYARAALRELNARAGP